MNSIVLLYTLMCNVSLHDSINVSIFVVLCIIKWFLFGFKKLQMFFYKIASVMGDLT